MSNEIEVQFPVVIKGCNTINFTEFPRVKLLFVQNFPGKSGTFRGDQEKIMSNFHESWFLTLVLP